VGAADGATAVNGVNEHFLDLDDVQKRIRDAGTFVDVGALEDIAYELIAELDRDLHLFRQFVRAIAQVRLIHARNERFPYYCVNCRSAHPCKTIRALDAVADPPSPEPSVTP
jgi:hypothetical protein